MTVSAVNGGAAERGCNDRRGGSKSHTHPFVSGSPFNVNGRVPLRATAFRRNLHVTRTLFVLICLSPKWMMRNATFLLFVPDDVTTEQHSQARASSTGAPLQEGSVRMNMKKLLQSIRSLGESYEELQWLRERVAVLTRQQRKPKIKRKVRKRPRPSAQRRSPERPRC